MGTRDITPDIDQLMAEADALVNQINASFIEEVEEKHRIQFEQHVQRLTSIKSTVKAKAEKKPASDGAQYGEGIHEAIVDIVKAMKNLVGYLSSNTPTRVRQEHEIEHEGRGAGEVAQGQGKAQPNVSLLRPKGITGP